jgi:hypothetical protein
MATEAAGESRDQHYISAKPLLIGSFSEGLDDTGAIATGNQWQWEPMARDSLPHPQIEVIECRCAQAYSDLTARGLLDRDLFEQQLIETSMFSDLGAVHRHDGSS